MNPVSPATAFGTAAELIVQLRLWQFGVQAASPLKDSGNDLIAIRGGTFRAIQVKGTVSSKIQIQTDDLLSSDGRERRYHLLALVFAPPVPTDGSLWRLDEVFVYLVERPDAPCTFHRDSLNSRRLSVDVVDNFWPIGT
jgi:hypothetical protein